MGITEKSKPESVMTIFGNVPRNIVLHTGTLHHLFAHQFSLNTTCKAHNKFANISRQNAESNVKNNKISAKT